MRGWWGGGGGGGGGALVRNQKLQKLHVLALPLSACLPASM